MEIVEFEIFVEGEGLPEVQAIRIPAGGSGREIVVAVAAMGGFPVEEGLLFVEDSEEPLDQAVAVLEDATRRMHHVHRVRTVEVSVYYQDRPETKRFSPSTRIQRILDWAIGPDGFHLDATIAPEMELSLSGSTTPLPKGAHLGRYVHHPDQRLVLDLVRGVVPNG